MCGRSGLPPLGLQPSDQLDVVVRDPLQRPARRGLEYEQPQLGAGLAVHLGEPGALGGQHDLVVERLMRRRDRSLDVPPRRRTATSRSSARWTAPEAAAAAPQRDAGRLDLERDAELRQAAHVLGDRLFTRAPRFGSI